MRKSKAPNKTTRGSEETSLLKKCLMGSTLLEMDGKRTYTDYTDYNLGHCGESLFRALNGTGRKLTRRATQFLESLPMRLELRAIAASVLIAHLYGPVFSQEAAGSPTPLNLKPIAEFRIKSDAFPYLDGERGAVLLSGIFSQNWFSGIGGIRVLDLKTGATVAERKYKGIKCTKDWDFSPEDLILLPGKPEILVKACAGLTVVDRNDLSIKRQLTMGQLKYVISGPFGHSIRLPMTYGVGRMLLSPDGARVVVQM